MKQRVEINPEITEKFENFIENERILLFSAPCGFGKSTVAKKLLKCFGTRVYEVCADETDFTSLKGSDKWDIMLIDRLQDIQSHVQQQALSDFIRDNHKKKFVILTRGAPPGWLTQFRLSGLMTVIGEDDLLLKRETVKKLFDEYGVKVSETVLSEIVRDSIGYPPAVTIAARHILCGEQYGKKVVDEITREIYLYFDEMVFKRFSMPVRRFLMELAPFEEFCTEFAKMVSGDAYAGEILARLQENTRMLKFEGSDRFRFWTFFHKFLMWEQNREYTVSQQKAIYSRGALYYELHEEYDKALEYYKKSGEERKISELLIRLTYLHPGMGHYQKLQKYYMSISDELVRGSPALMQSKSMMCALCGDYDASQRWYEELKTFEALREKNDAAAKEAKSRLLWLDIALPQRGVKGLADAINLSFRLIANREVSFPPFSVTSSLPSIMNGGKDFSEWSKKDDLMYATMRIPVEKVLGKDGIGLAECAIAESKFEKGENISGRMLAAVSKIGEVQNKGTPDIEFALVGLLARTQIDAGRAQDAKRTLETLSERYEDNGWKRFLPNIDAMLCRIALRCGDIDYWGNWYREKAPRDLVNVWMLNRYCYITQAMTELCTHNAQNALLTLAPLEVYCEKCERHIDMINVKVLGAIAKMQLNDEEWKDDISEAVSIAKKYGFVRSISTYGAAVIPLMENIENSSGFSQKVIKAARAQAVYYPDFLQPKSGQIERLTETETQVLRLICADKSNTQIGEILNIRLATVKSHVSHILQKCGVSRRSEAKTAAEKMHLI